MEDLPNLDPVGIRQLILVQLEGLHVGASAAGPFSIVSPFCIPSIEIADDLHERRILGPFSRDAHGTCL
jgi:hypothetical protein